MPLKSSLIVVKNAPILLAQLETGHMSVALMRGRQAKQSPNPNIHSTSTTAYMSKRGKQQGGALHKILWSLNYTLGSVRLNKLLIESLRCPDCPRLIQTVFLMLLLPKLHVKMWQVQNGTLHKIFWSLNYMLSVHQRLGLIRPNNCSAQDRHLTKSFLTQNMSSRCTSIPVLKNKDFFFTNSYFSWLAENSPLKRQIVNRVYK